MDAIARMRITRVSVAHRPETIAYADARIEVRDGAATATRQTGHAPVRLCVESRDD